MNKLLLSYAGDFSSFLVKNLVSLDNIRSIILFGSVARGEASKESDVDIFIELINPDKNFQKELNNLKKEFFESIRFKQYWSLLGVDNEFNLLSGTFDEWKELKNSIISNGIVMYGRFNAVPEGKHVLVTQWESVKPNTKRVLLNKKIFGYKQNNKLYKGILHKYSGQRLGKGSVILPVEAQKEMQELFKRFKITARIFKFMSYV